MSHASVHTLKDGNYQLSYIIPYSKERIRRKFQNHRLALAELREIEAKYRRPPTGKFANSTIDTLMDFHLRKCPRSRVKKTKRVFKSFMGRFGKTKIHNITKEDLDNWFHDEKEKRDLSYKTLKGWQTKFNYFFDFLVEQRAIGINPLKKIKFPSNVPMKRQRVVLAEEEIKEVLTHAKAFSPNFLHPLLYAYVHTGARKAEILNLEWRDVDFNTGTMLFRKTKNGEDRTIKIPPKLRTMLEKKDRRSHYVFTNESGLPAGREQLARRLSTLKKRFPNGKRWTIHSLRHSFAHQFLKNGGNMYSLQAILGHKSIHITINLYGQLQATEIENPSPYDF